jgi:lipopolysaccharide/colanic/teichoic acid biosynthesis glycosyltransferase
MTSDGWLRLKRILDLVFAAALVVPAAPLVALCIVAVRLADPGPGIFRHTREGMGGKLFDMAKIRTMRVQGDAVLDRWLDENPAGREELQAFGRLTHDPRMIPYVGGFLRRSSLDELPQLWHVIRGEMSLVGPRPFNPEALEGMPSEVVAIRRSVRPGMTGLGQVSGRSEHDLVTLVHMDCDYVRSWSFALDLRILLRTPLALVTGRGAY